MPDIQFVTVESPDGTDARVMLLEGLAGRALVMPVDIPQDEAYAFSVWIKASASGSVGISLLGNSQTVSVGTVWQRVTMVADSRSADEVRLTPQTDAGYYIYRAMLETGNKPGDWSPSPEDDAESIQTINQTLLELTPETIRLAQIVDTIAPDGEVARVTNSSLTLDENGIDMTGGEINIQAGAAFNVESGGTFQINADGTGQTDNFINLGGKFIVSEDGDLTCTQATVDEMKVNGYDPWTRGNLIVASEKPDITPCLWLQPNGTTAINFQGEMISTTAYLSSGAKSLTVAQTSTPGTTLPSGVTYNYTLTTSIGNTSSSNVSGIQIQATLSDGTREVTGFLSESFSLGAKSSRALTMSVYNSNINVCGTTAPITVTYSLVRSVGQNNIRVAPVYKNTLLAETPISSGQAVCTVYWCP